MVDFFLEIVYSPLIFSFSIEQRFRKQYSSLSFSFTIELAIENRVFNKVLVFDQN